MYVRFTFCLLFFFFSLEALYMMVNPDFLSDEFVPGTIHLVDLTGDEHAQHGSGGQRDIVLHPAPSNDPEDPLNWSHRRKLLATMCMFQ